MCTQYSYLILTSLVISGSMATGMTAEMGYPALRTTHTDDCVNDIDDTPQRQRQSGADIRIVLYVVNQASVCSGAFHIA